MDASEAIKKAIPENLKKWGDICEKVELKKLDDFPLEALPEILMKMTVEISETVKVPVEVPALSLLCTVGLCVGQDVFVQIKRGLKARANLYCFCFMAINTCWTKISHFFRNHLYGLIKFSC